MSQTSYDKSKLVGDVPRLPLRVAGQVAWSSIKVRLSRSLVTVSSVVLAVAFLLVVLGGDISDRAVYDAYAEDRRALQDVEFVQQVTARSREPLVLMRLLATDATIDNWTKQFDQTLPAYQVDDVTDLIALADWVADLKATDRFQVLQNREIHDWVVNLDGDAEVDLFLQRVSTFRGVRLTITEERIRALAQVTPTIRTAMSALRAAEAQRLAQATASGGADAALEGLRTEQTSLTRLTEFGIPVAHYFTELVPEREAGMIAELNRLHLVDAANQALDAANRAVPTANRLKLTDIQNGNITRRASDFKKQLTGFDPAVIQATPTFSALSEYVTDPETVESLKGSPDAQALIADTLLSSALNADDQVALLTYLDERSRLDGLTTTFLGAGFDPEATGERTFWLLVLSLLVCIVGIVNSMMMAVTERFREIATMKCLGAMDSFILKAFLIESGSVGMVGAFLGAILGVIIVFIQSTIRYGGSFWSALPIDLIALAALGSLVCGIFLTIFGALLPAYKAARMHPIEAMRLEA